MIFEANGEPLTAEKIFVTLSLIAVVADSTMILFTLGSLYLAQGLASLRRIQDFLDTEELSDCVIMRPEQGRSEAELTLDNVVARWSGQDSERPTLDCVSVSVGRGELVAIVGRVGSGKVNEQ